MIYDPSSSVNIRGDRHGSRGHRGCVRGHHLGEVRAAKRTERSSAAATWTAENWVFWWTDRYRESDRELCRCIDR